MFAEGARFHRCVLPASWYIEWQHDGTAKRRFALRPSGERVCYLAGIYTVPTADQIMAASKMRTPEANLAEGRSPHAPDPSVAAARFVVLTKAAEPDIGFIHDRMPVIIPELHLADWLDLDNAYADVVGLAATEIEYAPEAFTA